MEFVIPAEIVLACQVLLERLVIIASLISMVQTAMPVCICNWFLLSILKCTVKIARQIPHAVDMGCAITLLEHARVT